MILPIILVASSFAFLILEVFFVSFGMLAVIALALGVAGVVFAFDASVTYGWCMIAALVVGGRSPATGDALVAHHHAGAAARVAGMGREAGGWVAGWRATGW